MSIIIHFLATYLILIMIAFACYLFRKNIFMFSLLGFASYGFSKIIDMTIKMFYQVQRPYLTLGIDPLVTIPPKDSSFPSGHATSAFLLATLVYYYYNKKAGIFFYLMAVLVSIGRVLAFVHYPIDVIAGAVLGIASVLIIKVLAKKAVDN